MFGRLKDWRRVALATIDARPSSSPPSPSPPPSSAGSDQRVLTLVGVTGIALKPSVFRIIANGDDKSDLGAKAPAGALSALPKTHGDVSQLGPPLPGDLGKPILERQQQLLGEGSTLPPPISDAKAQAEQAAQAERERRLAEVKAARQSALIVQSGGRTEALPQSATTRIEDPVASDPGKVALDSERDPNDQQRKSDFFERSTKEDGTGSHVLARLVPPYMLAAGSVIAGSLITGIRSDLPGLVTAQVTENVFDSATGRILVVPQGARLIGKYDSVVSYSQKRALVVWQRIVLPDGSSLGLDNVPASDASGYSELADISTLLGSAPSFSSRGRAVLSRRFASRGSRTLPMPAIS